MYVDESGDCGLNNSPTRYFILCGLVIHELRWQPIIEELIVFRKSLKTSFGLKLREEIHAAELINHPGPLARIPKHHRLEILRRFADKLASIPDASLIAVVIDKQGKSPTYDVFQNAWSALIQRFENTLSHRNFPGPKNPDDRGLLICDRTDDKKLVRLVRRMRSYNPIQNQPQFGSGYRDLKIRSIIEDPNFRESGDSQLIQATDTCSYLLQQNLNPSKFFKKKSGQNYFTRLHPICCKAASNKDPYGIVRL